ncbi:hypothetical protein BJX70DRAFT_379554 [Aspergillus crustosus]
MATINPTQSKYFFLTRKMIWQKPCCHETSLLRKVYEYSKMSLSDVCMGIHI